MQSNPSLHFFKTYLYTSRIKIPNYFYFGTRIGQTLHSKLRLECSGLNLHLFQRKLINSPLCICGEVESTDHFLLHCNTYSRLRINTILTLPYFLNVELLLYGNANLSESENNNIFYHVQKFLVESKRFWVHLLSYYNYCITLKSIFVCTCMFTDIKCLFIVI